MKKKGFSKSVILFLDPLVMSYFRRPYVLIYVAISVISVIQKVATFEGCERNYSRVKYNFKQTFKDVSINEMLLNIELKKCMFYVLTLLYLL